LRDIGSPLACYLLKQPEEPKLHLEYIPQYGDTMLDDVVDRIAQCTLQSIAMVVGTNIRAGLTDSDDRTYYLIKGMKPSTVRISGSKSTEYLIVVDFEAKSITTSETTATAGFGYAPDALTGAYCAFNVAGEITKTGGEVVNTNHIAFITNAIEITFSHKLTGYTDHNALQKTFLIEGEMDAEGSVDITLDGGGGRHIAEVFANTSFTLTVDLGAATAPRITLPACEWKNSSVPLDIGGEAIMNSVPFTCKPTACNTLVSVVPS